MYEMATLTRKSTQQVQKTQHSHLLDYTNLYSEISPLRELAQPKRGFNLELGDAFACG